MITLAIVSLIISLICVAYTIHTSIVFHIFNENIKSWSVNIDNSTRDAINRSARDILRELDEKISSMKEEENNLKQEENGNE